MKAQADFIALTPRIVQSSDPESLLFIEREALKKLRDSKRGAEGLLGFGIGVYLFVLTLVVVLLFSNPMGLLVVLTMIPNIEGTHISPLGLLFLGSVVSMLLVSLGATVSLTRIDDLRQEIEDRLARIAFIELASGLPTRLSLYLRAFDTTGQIRASSGNSFLNRYIAVMSYFGSEVWAAATKSRENAYDELGRPAPLSRSEKYEQLFVSRRNHAELEAAIAHDTRRDMPLVALGLKDNRDGAGKVSTTDEEWKESVSLLISIAERIFCVPDDNPGTLWEVKQLKFLCAIDRTIFIMPSSKMLPDRQDSFPADWAHMVELVRSEGLYFPDYDPAGGFFGVNAEGVVDYRISFSLGSRGTFRYIHDEMQRMRRPAEVLDEESYDRRRRRRNR